MFFHLLVSSKNLKKSNFVIPFAMLKLKFLIWINLILNKATNLRKWLLIIQITHFLSIWQEKYSHRKFTILLIICNFFISCLHFRITQIVILVLYQFRYFTSLFQKWYPFIDTYKHNHRGNKAYFTIQIPPLWVIIQW